MEKWKIIKIDVDGVIRDLFTTMCELYNETFGTEMTPDDIIDYNTDISFPLIKKRIGSTGNEFFFTTNSARTFFCSKVIPGAAEAIRKLRAAGLRIEICTYQPTEEGRRFTCEFLKYNHIEFDGLHFTDSKWMIHGDVLVDDSPDFLCSPEEDSVKICVKYPFNSSIRETCNYTVSSLSEAADIILSHNAGISSPSEVK